MYQLNLKGKNFTDKTSTNTYKREKRMGRPNKAVQRLLASVGEPQDELKSSEVIGQLTKGLGNSQHEFLIPQSQYSKLVAHFNRESKEKITESDRTIVVLMPPKFRNTVFVKRGGLVVVDLYEPNEIDPKQEHILGDISNIVRNQKDWQKMAYFPVEFKEEEKKNPWDFDGLSDEEEEEEEE